MAVNKAIGRSVDLILKQYLPYLFCNISQLLWTDSGNKKIYQTIETVGVAIENSGSYIL